MTTAVDSSSDVVASLNGASSHVPDFGLPLRDLYRLGVRFYKEKSGGKAAELSYDDRVALVAYTQQATHGKYDDSRAQPLGYLDVIGHDRRRFWQTLGDMPKEEAMESFVERLIKAAPLFLPYVEAHKRNEEMKRREDEEKVKELELAAARAKLHEEDVLKQEVEMRQQEERKRMIQDALNAQTFPQFKAYAEQQYPGNPEQQAVLIKQLQQQHYTQYMQQIYQQRQMDSEKKQNSEDASDLELPLSGDASADVTDDEGSEGSAIQSASMWTRKDMKEFKEGVKKEGGDAVIRVGHGETVTVRVPTHEDGSCLFWEFATDSYDIGFGLFFEWVKSPTEQVSVHISESEDEEDEPEGPEAVDEDGDEIIDPERGARSPKSRDDEVPTSVVIPVYRRDCHEEVYAGSHPYPGQGVYLLKFDNAYSLWRSKTLYYRVYYTR